MGPVQLLVIDKKCIQIKTNKRSFWTYTSHSLRQFAAKTYTCNIYGKCIDSGYASWQEGVVMTKIVNVDISTLHHSCLCFIVTLSAVMHCRIHSLHFCRATCCCVSAAGSKACMQQVGRTYCDKGLLSYVVGYRCIDYRHVLTSSMLANSSCWHHCIACMYCCTTAYCMLMLHKVNVR